jgi:hypothetical protein
LGTTNQGGANVVESLVNLGVLHEMRRQGRTRLFAFRPYLDLLHETSDDLGPAIGRNDQLAATQST